MSKIFLLAIYAGILAGASAREGDLAADEPNDIAADASVQDHPTPAPDARQVKTASGPLRVHPTNPRYFTDNSGRALYFAGSDTYGLNHKFDEWPTFTGSWNYFVEFLDWMESHNQNFLRCWGGFSYLVHTPWHTQKNTDAESIQKWVWKTFARGHHPLMLEMYRHGDAMHPDQIRGEINHAYDFVRRALGDTVAYSKRFRSLAQMVPTSAPAQCSTRYCLRNPGQDYLVYQPEGGSFTVNLKAADYEFEWFDPAAGVVVQTGTITAAAGSRTFTPPFSGDAVLYLARASRG